MSQKRAAIIAVGTEITSGQTKNTHAPWIAAQLDDFGIEPILHLAVPDDNALMLQVFEEAADLCEFIFITGGLGPTRDDFTRNSVAKWLQLRLEFRDDIWTELQERLTERSVTVSPNHKNQCYFPEGADILPNEVGTAHGFFITTRAHKIWVLPGPTPELQFIWKDSVLDQLKYLGAAKSFEVMKWRCLGKPESELADLVESALEGSGLQTGYRLTTPYVEVKVWVPETMTPPDRSKWVEKLESTIKPWLLVKGDTDLGRDFLDRTLQKEPLTIIDDVSSGQILERLMTLYRENRQDYGFELRGLTSTSAELEGISFGGTGSTLRTIATEDKLTWWVELKTSTLQQKEQMKFQSSAKVNPDRLGKVITELSLHKALQWLNK